MGALWQWWQGFAPRVGEELLTWSWHVAGLVVLVWMATMLLRSKHARIRGALWLAALLLIPLLPVMVRLSPLPSTSVAELASSVRPAKAPAPPAAEPTLPSAATEIAVEPVSPAAPTAVSIETVSPAAEAASAAVPEPMVAARSHREAEAPAFWREGRFWIGSAVLAWALVAAARLTRVFASLLWIRKLVRSADAVGDARLAQAFATTCAQIGVGKRVELLSSDLILVPVTIGVLRPAVIVPRDLAASGRQGALDHVLYHELAHVRRSDAAVTLYRRVLEAVLFFHPLLWLASRRYEVEQEHICDDWALAALGDRGGYARALSELAAQATHAAPVAALGFAHRPSIIRLRVTRVLEETGMPQPRLDRLGLLTVATVSLLVLALTTSFPLSNRAAEARAAEAPKEGAVVPSRLVVVADRFEGQLEFDRSIPLPLRAETPEGVRALRVDPVKFVRGKEQVHARLDVDWAAQADDANWHVIIQLLSEHGSILSQADAVFATHRVDREWPGQRLFFSFGRWSDVSKATKFAVSIEQAAPDAARTGTLVRWDRWEYGDLSLEVQFIDSNGQPGKGSEVTFWRAVTPDEVQWDRREPTDPWEVRRWDDASSGRTWQSFLCTGAAGKSVVQDLPAGYYLVTATSYRGRESPDPTPVGVGEPIHLDGSSKKTVATVQLRGDLPLTVKVIDAETGKPVGPAQFLLFRADGFPIGYGPSGCVETTDSNGVFRYGHLTPGAYWLQVRKKAREHGQTEYVTTADRIRVDVGSGQENSIEVALHAVELDPAEVQRRWPFVVGGTVTDGEGKPLAGVQVTAHSGVGTLQPTGSVTSGPDGKYTLRFGPGVHILDEASGRWKVGLQAGFVSARKAGYYEKDLSAHGKLAITDEPPAAGSKHYYRDVVVPNQAYLLDFVMVPAVAIQGRIVDKDGRAVTPQLFSVSCEGVPEGNVWDHIDTDQDGQFTALDLPAKPLWFELRDDQGRESTSKTVNFGTAGAYRVELVYDAGTSDLECRLISSPPVRSEQAAQAPAAATATEMTLKHDDGTMEGKRSLGASGHFVRFWFGELGKWYLTEVQVFGSRYGSPEPPPDSFTITLCDGRFKTVRYIKKPYSIFQRGDERWYNVPVPPVELPSAEIVSGNVEQLLLWVNVAFNPSSTKGVYVGYDTSDAQCFSKVGLPDQTPELMSDNGDWMVRLVVTQNPPKQVAPELGAWVEPPKPARSPQEEGLVELKNDDGESDGKRSMGGTGPASRFEGVPEGATLTRLRMYASRYGSGFDPETTFADYYVFDDEKRILQTGRIPYSLFTYEEKWVDVPLKPVKVPSAFWVLINPQAHQSKGIYTHYDTDVQATHSKSGRIPEEMRDLEKKWDWMVRAYVQLAVVGRQESVPVVETELWRVEGRSYFVALSPDGKSVALTYRGQPPEKQYVLRDGKRVGEIYDVLHWVTFSPDGRSLAFAAKSGDKWFMVKDGEALDDGHGAVSNPVFSPDSRSLAYAVTDGREHFVLRDGERAGPGGISWAGLPVFSPDGRSLVYITARGEQYSIVRDGVATPALGQRMVSKPVFSPDGRSIAYVAESGGFFGGTCFLVKDGERVGEEGTYVRGPSDAVFMGVNNPVFSPDGSSLAWVAPTGRKEFLVRDGARASKDYDRVSGITFSPDGRSLTFVAREGVRSLVIRDGVQVGPEYRNVVFPIRYGPDGRPIAFWVQERGRSFIAKDGVQVTPDYEGISNIVTTPDGKTMVFAAIRDKVVYRVEVPWAEAQPATGQ